MQGIKPYKYKKHTKVQDLRRNSKEIDIAVKVISKKPPRNVSLNDNLIHKITDVLVGDETGSIFLTLWDAKIDKISEGETVKIKKGFISLDRGSMRLNVPFIQGCFQPLEESPILEVNTQKNLSNKKYGKGHRRIRRRSRRY